MTYQSMVGIYLAIGLFRILPVVVTGPMEKGIPNPVATGLETGAGIYGKVPADSAHDRLWADSPSAHCADACEGLEPEEPSASLHFWTRGAGGLNLLDLVIRVHQSLDPD